MTIRDDRSMNAELRVGAVEGKVRLIRPDAANADEAHAQQRAGVLHSQFYGSMGISTNDAGRIDANVATATAPYTGV